METLEQEMKKWIGQTLDDRYEIKSLVGAGGMAWVYRATDLRLNRNVAVKIMREDAASDETVRQFLQKAQAMRTSRQRNTILNYDERPAHARLEDIAFDINEL